MQHLINDTKRDIYLTNTEPKFKQKPQLSDMATKWGKLNYNL